MAQELATPTMRLAPGHMGVMVWQPAGVTALWCWGTSRDADSVCGTAQSREQAYWFIAQDLARRRLQALAERQ